LCQEKSGNPGFHQIRNHLKYFNATFPAGAFFPMAEKTRERNAGCLLSDTLQHSAEFPSVKNTNDSKQWAPLLDCQMVRFQAKNSNLGKFWRVLRCKFYGHL
jgi:hypothetical protein